MGQVPRRPCIEKAGAISAMSPAFDF